MHAIGNNNHRVGVYDGKIAGLYDLEETLGSGHFAVVKLARHVFTGEKVAVKVIDKTKLDEVSRAHLFQEVRCMKLVQHPNVVRLYEVIDTQTKLYLILELGDGGDLYDYIMKHDGGLTEQLAKEYFRQIVRAISYCHQLHVVHRDLKPENVVFFEKLGVVKLTDFGFSNKFCPGQKLETSCGSLAYSAPEILLGDSYDAPAVDVWSLGVILYMLVCGHPPFQEANDSETLTMIMDCKYTIPPHISAECKDLIGNMLVVAPDKRYTLQKIAQSAWLAQDGHDADNQPDPVPEYLPLISRQQVSEDDHTLIIQKMVNGSIAAKEEIIEALDKNEYNHITATYFLLAERKLRAHRQEQAQKRRPELSLPVPNASSRLSPKSRLQGLKDELHASQEVNNEVLLPTSVGHLSVPRTPGPEGTQTGRTRKCSIVQEEEDDEDDADADESITLNRRGSRSEGRINITVQDRIVETERLKKESAAAAAIVAMDTSNAVTTTIATAVPSVVSNKGGGLFDGMCGVTIISSNDNDPKEKLGVARYGMPKRPCDLRSYVADVLNNKAIIGKSIEYAVPRSNSVDQGSSTMRCNATTDDTVCTTFLTDSSTISIPIVSQQYSVAAVPKYKTMPSPTRANTIRTSGAGCLNEIFEEGTDVGSSDSAGTTPRPATRHAHYISNRAHSVGAAPATHGSSGSGSQRRSKFHKTRTASCSSSDASDDDSENRKKRAHKIVDSTKPIQAQRRDSHDDSSDSQDPGNATSSGSTSNTYPIQVVVGNSHPDKQKSSTAGGGGSSSGAGNNSGNSRQKSGQSMGFRRHRAGRRRAGETRLRESQSLNRITEVQESELPLTALVQTAQISMAATAAAHSAALTVTAPPPPQPTKTRGFSARLFGFRKTTDTSVTTPTSEHCSSASLQAPIAAEEEVEMVLGVELAKALKVTETKSTSSSATKKLKMLGRYFQVHKKLCIPLPGIFQRGRLYKAQSCSSIMRDKVNQPAGLGQSTASRHSALFSDKTRILRNCLGARLLGSDGDINQNNDLASIGGVASTPGSVVFSMTAKGAAASSTKAFNIPKTSSPLHHHQQSHHQHHRLSDASLCSSKC